MKWIPTKIAVHIWYHAFEYSTLYSMCMSKHSKEMPVDCSCPNYTWVICCWRNKSVLVSYFLLLLLSVYFLLCHKQQLLHWPKVYITSSVCVETPAHVWLLWWLLLYCTSGGGDLAITVAFWRLVSLRSVKWVQPNSWTAGYIHISVARLHSLCLTACAIVSIHIAQLTIPLLDTII